MQIRKVTFKIEAAGSTTQCPLKGDKTQLYIVKPRILRHCTSQPALASNSLENWRILLVQSFTAHMPLLMAIVYYGEDAGVLINSIIYTICAYT